MPRLRSICILLTLAALAAPRVAAADTDQAQREYAQGYAALQRGDYAEALARYQQSYRLAPRPRTLFNMAVSQEGLGQLVEAWHSYHAFVARAEERDREFVARARARIAALRERVVGHARVTSEPAGALVRVDGERRARGRTPLTLALAPGRHELVLSLEDGRPVTRMVTIEPGANTAIAVALEHRGSLVVHARPSDALIVPSTGRPARGTYRAQLLPGTYHVTVRRRGYRDEAIAIDVEAGQRVVHHVALRTAPRVAALRVAGPVDAKLAIGSPADGADAASVANAGLGVPHDLAPGLHRVHVERRGYHPWVDTVHLSPGERVSIDVHLRRRHSRWLVWGGIGLGAATLASGGVLGVGALQDAASDDARRRARGERRALIVDGLLVVSAAAFVTSWYLGRDSSATVHRTGGGR